MSTNRHPKTPRLPWILLPICACICCLAVLMTEVPYFEPGSRGVEEVHLSLQTGARPPKGGMCREIGEEHPENPFLGWPTLHYVSDWRTITAWWLDPEYFRGYTHWGIDFGSWVDTTGARYTANLAEVVSTAVFAVVVASTEDGGHHHGIGNHVIIKHVTCEEVCGNLEDELQAGWWHFLVQKDARKCAPVIITTTPGSGTPTPQSVERNHPDLILLCEESGWKASYFHLASVSVGVPQLVEYGDILGQIGNTGNSTGPHLHYQINCPDGGTIDPAPAMCQTYSNELRGISQWRRDSVCERIAEP